MSGRSLVGGNEVFLLDFRNDGGFEHDAKVATKTFELLFGLLNKRLVAGQHYVRSIAQILIEKRLVAQIPEQASG